MLGHLRRLAECVARVQRRDVGIGDHRLLGELALQPFDRVAALVAIHPEQQSQRPHVAAEVRLA